MTMTVSTARAGLVPRGMPTGRVARPARHYRAELLDVFFEPGEPRTRRIFVRDPQGRVTGIVDRREARDVVWRRTDGSR